MDDAREDDIEKNELTVKASVARIINIQGTEVVNEAFGETTSVQDHIDERVCDGRKCRTKDKEDECRMVGEWKVFGGRCKVVERASAGIEGHNVLNTLSPDDEAILGIIGSLADLVGD